MALARGLRNPLPMSRHYLSLCPETAAQSSRKVHIFFSALASPIGDSDCQGQRIQLRQRNTWIIHKWGMKCASCGERLVRRDEGASPKGFRDVIQEQRRQLPARARAGRLLYLCG